MPKKPVKKSTEGCAACFVKPDGSVSDQELHDQIMDGVDDRDAVLFARAECKDVLNKADLDRLFPLPPMTTRKHPFDKFVTGDLEVIPSQCNECVHWRVGTTTCAAYPDGIPEGVMSNEVSHTEPLPGDGGLLFTAKDLPALKRRSTTEGISPMVVPSLDDKCSRHFTYRMFVECGETQRREGISNLPLEMESYLAIKDLATQVLDAVQEHFGPIKLTYGFSSRELIRKIPGRIAPDRDQHAAHERKLNGSLICDRLGAACDFKIEGKDMREVAEWMFRNTGADRIYFYGNSNPVHVSYSPRPARQFVEMRVVKSDGKKDRLMPRVVRLV
jgi:hypothetical protein